MRLLLLSEYTFILSTVVFLIGCESNLTPDSDKLGRAHPAAVGSTFTFDQIILDSLGNITDDYRNNTFTDSIVSNGVNLGMRDNVTTFRRTAKNDSIFYTYYSYNFEHNGDLSIYFGYPPRDTVWPVYPIESHIPIINTYHDTNTKTGIVRTEVASVEYDSTVTVAIGDTILKWTKIKTISTITSITPAGYKSVYVYKAYLIIVPSIGYIVEWRTEPATVNGHSDGQEGSLWILRSFHLR